MLKRRGLLLGLIAAPAIVRTGILMPVKADPLKLDHIIYTMPDLASEIIHVRGYNAFGAVVTETVRAAHYKLVDMVVHGNVLAQWRVIERIAIK